MKTFFKILGITLASVVGLAVVAVALALYVVFTPKHLTPLVDQLAKDYITCDYRIDDIEPTFFSTFPEFGLRTGKLLVLNPTVGAPSDTLLAADRVVARLELMQLLKEGCLNIREVGLQGVQANIFIAEDGHTNFDVLRLPADTTEEDTSAGFLRTIKVEELRFGIDAQTVTFLDLRDTISAELHNVDIALFAEQKDSLVEGCLDLALPNISASMKGVDYASNAQIRLTLPFTADIAWTDGRMGVEALSLDLKQAELAVNKLKANVTGHAKVLPEIDVDMRLNTNTWHIGEVLALVPDELFTMPEGITAEGKARVSAHVCGKYNEDSFPYIAAHLVLSDATGTYAELPYTLQNVAADANLKLDLNRRAADATVNSLSADVENSSVSVTGQVTDLMNDMLLDLDVNAGVHLPDLAYFLPKGTHVKGNADGKVHLRMLLDDLKEMNLTNGNISGNLQLRNLQAEMDSMAVAAPKANLAFAIPNATAVSKTDKEAVSRRKHLNFLSGKLALPGGLDFAMTDGPQARVEEGTINIQMGDILKNRDIVYADLDVKTAGMSAEMDLTDSLGQKQHVQAQLSKPDICAYVEYDQRDTAGLPALACDFRLERLQAIYDTIRIDSRAPQGAASIRGGRRDKSQPQVQLRLHMNALDAALGKTLAMNTGNLSVNLRAHRSDNKENILLEWNPRLQFDIQQVVATPAEKVFAEKIRVPEIKFAFSNKVFDIDTARVELGRSNFSLSGTVTNIGPWLEDTGLLTGNLNFTSSMADIDQLMEYTSGIGNQEESTDDSTEEPTAREDAPNPYIVPKGTDLVINTHIQEARALEHDVHNLKGRVYVKDGLLVLEQMGFICKAARLELTAMYKTPRKNHLYAGLDYHMYDINVAELVDLIPQVDTLLPMLRAFRGNAEFHLAAETYLNGFYEIKPSTSRGACSISGTNLTVLDGETFSKIAKLLTFKKSTENKIDSISAEITLFRKEVDVYPFLVSIDKWKAAVGGQYRPYEKAQQHNYHISLLSPLYLGVDVLTDPKNSDKLKINLAKCKYAKDFSPVYTKVVETQAMDVRRLIREALTAKNNK